ncbi:MAG: cation:proton antiporter, partial [Burkholderiales bacterium]
ESLLNDASGLVCFRFAVAAALTGSFSLAEASETFMWLAAVGIAVGVGFTMGVSFAQVWLSRHFGEDAGAPILMSLLIPFGAYLLAEYVEASGILAAVAAGITMSHVELSGRAQGGTRMQRAAVWDMLQFTLNGIVFVLLGEQLPGILQRAVVAVEQSGHLSPWWLLVYTLVITSVLAGLRYAWVWTSLRLTLLRARYRGEQRAEPNRRLIIATSLAGVRGAITLAGVLTLPLLLPDGTPFPARDLVVFLAAAVILLSLLVASVALPRILEGLEVPAEPAKQREEDHARREAASAAIAAIENARHDLPYEADDADVYASAAARVIDLYQRRVDDGALSDVEAEELHKADRAERALRLAGLRAERERIFNLARASQISDETSRKLVREIDLAESRYR